MTRRIAATAACSLLASFVVCATSGAESLAAAIERYNRHAEVPLPLPDDRQMARLVDGRTVILRERRSMSSEADGELERIRVVGYRRVARPRLLVWLAALDIGAAHSDRLTEHLVEFDDQGGSVWYQFLNTPWPVTNRHWVIRNAKSVDVAVRSDGRIWEHAWRLKPAGQALARNLLSSGQVSGVTPRDGERAIYLAINRGAWTMMEIDSDTTLVAAHTAADMGGWIPESWVARFVAGQLGGALDALEEKAGRIHARYDGSYPVFTGSGRRITPAMARAEYESWLLRAGNSPADGSMSP